MLLLLGLNGVCTRDLLGGGGFLDNSFGVHIATRCSENVLAKGVDLVGGRLSSQGELAFWDPGRCLGLVD